MIIVLICLAIDGIIDYVERPKTDVVYIEYGCQANGVPLLASKWTKSISLDDKPILRKCITGIVNRYEVYNWPESYEMVSIRHFLKVLPNFGLISALIHYLLETSDYSSASTSYKMEIHYENRVIYYSSTYPFFYYALENELDFWLDLYDKYSQK